MLNQKLTEDQFQEIELILKDYLTENNLFIKSINLTTNNFIPGSKDLILEVSISSASDENIALEKIVKISKLLNQQLSDSKNFDLTELALDVSSSGIEKTINSFEELLDNLNKEIYVELADNNYQGKLLVVSPEEIVMSVNFKGQFRKIKFNYSAAKFIRKAISVKKEIGK